MTAASEQEEAKATLARSAVFSGADLSEARVARLGGLTNRVFRIDLAGTSYFLLIRGMGTV